MGQERQSQSRPDATHLEQQIEQLPLLESVEAVQLDRIFPHDHPGMQEERVTYGRTVLDHRVWHGDFEAHPADLEGHGGLPEMLNHAAHRRDHPCPSSRLWNPEALMWQMAMARASATSSGRGGASIFNNTRTIS